MAMQSTVIHSKSWNDYFNPNLTKEQRKIFVALNSPARTTLYKDDSSLLSSLVEEKIKLSKNNKIYKTKSTVAKIIPKNGKLYFVEKNKKIRILWSENAPIFSGITREDILKFYNADWLLSYLDGILTLKMVKPSVLKKHKITNIRQLLKHIYPNLFPEWILKNQKYLFARNLIEINNFLNYAEDKESYTKYILVSEKYPNITFLHNKAAEPEDLFAGNRRLNGLNVEYYRDIGNMCKILNQNFKLSWGLKRITEFHDSLTSELNSFRSMFKAETKFEPALRHQTLPLDKFELITSGRRLLQEGLDLSHCVASYEGRISSGHCAIYSIEWESKRYTIEMVEWTVNQCRGYKNCNPPPSLVEYIEQEKLKYSQHLSSILNSDSSSEEEKAKAKAILGKANYTNKTDKVDDVYFPINIHENLMNFPEPIDFPEAI